MWRHIRTAGLAVVPALALVVGTPGTAQAAPLVHEHYSDTDSGSLTECGLDIGFQDSFRGLFQIREVRGSDGQAFLGQDNYDVRSVWTNTANGRWLAFRANGMFKEISATHVDGDIWTFTSHETGQPFVVEDSAGNVVLRDRGMLAISRTFDLLGDGEPGGELLDEEVLGMHGPHPGFELDETAFCTMVTGLIG